MKSLTMTALLMSAGCATAVYRPQLKYDDKADATEHQESAKKLENAQVKDVLYTIGEFPEGVKLDDELLTVSPESPWEYIGKVEAIQDKWRGFWFTRMYRYNDHEKWKRTYCFAQAPLHWLTFGLWTIVPTDYPCTVATKVDTDSSLRRKEHVIAAMQKGAMVSGADLLVVTGETQTQHNGMMMVQVPWDGAEGYLFKKKGEQ